MDAFELLKTDHEKVSQLFKEIESASGQAKGRLFKRLKGELDVHAHIEEKVLYPALENTEDAREITLEAYEEHKVVKDLLAELAKGGPLNDEWDAKLTVLKENVEHHVEEEEGELFSKARKALSDEELDRIGAELEAEKARAQGATVKPSRAAKGVKRSSPQSASGTGPATTGTSDSRRRPSKVASKAESPGVLKRIANFIGLGDGSSSKGKATKKTGKVKSASKSSSSKASGSKKAAKRASTKATSGTKAGTKSAAKRSGGKKTGSANASLRSTTSRANKRQSTSSRGKATTKAAARSGSKKGKKGASTKRKTTS